MTAAAPRFPHVLIRASAGTGKTFQLSNRYIGLAASGQPLDTILATTFTRKAAGEILDRILTRVAEAALSPAAAAQLAQHTGLPAFNQQAALGLLRSMIRHLHRIRTGTLDSFFLQIARSFALELGLPLGWQIIDDVSDGLLRGEAVRNVLADEATGDVVRLMHLLTKGEAARSVSQQISALVTELYNLYADSPQSAWHSLSRHKELALGELSAALDALEAAAMPGKRFVTARAADLETARAADWETFLGKGLSGKIFAGEESYYRTPIGPEVLAVYEPLLKHARAVLVNRIVLQTEATWRLLDRFDKAYQRLKVEHRALRFEDITRRLGSAAVGQRLEAVVYRLDAHVAHLLLDEFQDTSPLQWRVLRPFAQAVADQSGRRSFFCVGDVKQAIYGWRGGVAEIFEALSDELPGLQGRALNESFRSSPVVIDVVNRVFGGLGGNAVLQNHGEATRRWRQRFQEHTTARTQLGGYCRLETAPRAEPGKTQPVANLVHAANEIVRLHEACPGRTIGVLVRRNAGVARMIYELRTRGLRASEEGGNPLIDSPAVQVVLSVLQVADHPGDTAARFHVAHSPLGGPLGLEDHADGDAAARQAAQLRRQLGDRGYGPTLEAWVRLLGPHCDERDLGRLAQLVELAYTYDAQATTRPDDFVRLVQQKRVEDARSTPVRVMTIHQSKGLQFDIVVLPELDARLVGQPGQVAVGRASPTAPVERVCRYVGKELRGLLPAAWRQMFEDGTRQVVEESLSVLYVAMTRAIHALHVIISPSAPNERSLSCTFGHLLRAALTDGKPLEPCTVAFEHGDSCWFERSPATAVTPLSPSGRGAGVEGAEGTKQPELSSEPRPLRLAPAAAVRSRGLERQSPSGLEGAGRVQLGHEMRLDRGALDRGTLVHRWFAEIEWLDEGPPPDARLLEVAAEPDFRGVDARAVLADFHAALARPAIAAALRRSGCAQAAIAAKIAQPRWEVWRERTFAIRDGEALLSGSIDRLVVLWDGDRPVWAEVLDYKTDVLPAGDAAAAATRADFYRPQLAAYRRAAAALLGLPPEQIAARLLFLVPGTVVAC